MIGGRVANLCGRGMSRAPLSWGEGSRTSVVGGRVAHLCGRGKGRAPP